MTDKISMGDCCTYPNGDDECKSVYHSCANIKITGTQDPATYAANNKYSGPQGPYTQESVVGLTIEVYLILL